MAKSKFNVSKNTSKRTYDNIIFDSELEMKYYRDVLLPKVQSGEIVEYELQKKYELQPKFKHDNKTVLPINYVADFYIRFKDGTELIVDTKGMADSSAKLKRKMFFYIYPDKKYIWMSYCKKYGGWIDYDELQKKRRNDKKCKK